MSLETWRKEFYSIEANAVPEEKAVKHSLRKWTGLLKKNLKKHGVSPDQIRDSIRTGVSSCALCQHFFDLNCVDCPIFLESGKRCEDTGSAFRDWCNNDAALPLVQLLTRIDKKGVSVK